MNKSVLILLLTAFAFISFSFVTDTTEGKSNADVEESRDLSGAIKPYSQNSWYWEYRGEPIVLIGGSDDHNLYQWAGNKLTDHLDLMASLGGNYVRNTMSDREVDNIFAFRILKNKSYDLNQWNDEFWNRLTFFLDETTKRGIIAQFSLWDHFDITASVFWDRHPWNPKNNINKGTASWKTPRDFYTTLARNDQEGLKFQQQFVDKILSITLRYDNVLYNINNESSESLEWENYWALYINQAAQKAGREVYVTTMQFDPANSVRHVMTYPDIYKFVEISQNNQDSRGGRGKAHWDNIMSWREKIGTRPEGPMPMNNEKIYGGMDGRNFSAGSENEAVDRFWRNVLAGCAASRFHRPAGGWGSGLNERVQRNLKSMSMLLEELDIISCSPQNGLLSSRVLVGSTMEAYLTANIGSQYAVYFPQGRYTVNLDPWVYVEKLKLRWLDVDQMQWSEPEIVEVQWEGDHYDWGNRGKVSLTTPSNRQYVALLEVVE